MSRDAVNPPIGKVAIVTGGGGGLGRAIALEFAASGIAVAVADVSAALAEETVAAVCAAGGRAIAVPVDMADVDSVAAMVAATVERFGGLDILVNNANETRQAFLDSDVQGFDAADPDVFDAYMAVGPRGTLFACKFAAPEMIRRGGGAIVNVVSVSALKGGLTQVAYSAAKAATVALTRKAATRWGKQGIRVNAVAPGLIVHERLLQRWPALAQSSTDSILLDHFGEPQDIADAVAFLAGQRARFITGHVLVVDGGGMVGSTYGAKPAMAGDEHDPSPGG